MDEDRYEFAPRLTAALKEAERFLEYFAGETGGTFVGPGTPQSCLATVREAIAASEVTAEQLEEYGDGLLRQAARMSKSVG